VLNATAVRLAAVGVDDAAVGRRVCNPRDRALFSGALPSVERDDLGGARD